MKNKQKGFAIPIIIAVVALLALGGRYVYYQSNNINTIPESSIPDVVSNVPTTTKVSDRSSFQTQDQQNAARESARLKSEDPVACTKDAKQCPDGSYVGRSGPNCEFVCPVIIDTDVPPPLGNSTLRISCGMEEIPGCTDVTKNTCSYMTKCNTEGVNPTRSDFYLIVDGGRIKVLIDIETRLRFTMGPNETLKKWADFYPNIQGGPFGGGMPFGATIYGDWIDATTFKANWIKWTVG
jgi:hypothetical protein